MKRQQWTLREKNEDGEWQKGEINIEFTIYFIVCLMKMFAFGHIGRHFGSLLCRYHFWTNCLFWDSEIFFYFLLFDFVSVANCHSDDFTFKWFWIHTYTKPLIIEWEIAKKEKNARQIAELFHSDANLHTNCFVFAVRFSSSIQCSAAK